MMDNIKYKLWVNDRLIFLQKPEDVVICFNLGVPQVMLQLWQKSIADGGGG